MRDKQQPFDLSTLENDYDVVGELGATGVGRAYFGTRKEANAKRRDDNTGVLIEVIDRPAGDEGNALSHLASDAQILSRLSHRRLIPMIEGRWVGKEVLAVITKRTSEPTLAQLLTAGETFSNPRTAAILREVNGLLEWAREQKIVHRGVTPDRLYFEPKTDRVRVSFAVAPIPRVQRVSAEDQDARTIATLAMTMLTGSVDPKAYEGESLAELRPDLPEQLVDETAALLAGETTDVDVNAYLALVGMADPLAAGETAAERLRADVLEEQRVEREKLAAERAALEREMEGERQKLAMEAEQLRAKHQADVEALQRKCESDEKALLRKAATDEETLRKTYEAHEETLRKKYETDEQTLRQKYETNEEALRRKCEIDEKTLRTKYAAEEEALRKKYESEEETLRRAIADERARMEHAGEEEGQRVANERAIMERSLDEERQRVSEERARMERAVEEERTRITKERAELLAAVAAERAAIVAQRTELEREVAQQRAELERVAREDRERIDALRAEIEWRGELEMEKRRDTALEEMSDEESTLDDGELATPPFEAPMIAPLAQLEFDDATALRNEDVEYAPIFSEPARVESTPAAIADDSGEPAAAATSARSGRKKWLVPASIAGVVVIAAILAGLIGSRYSSTPPAGTRAALTAVAPAASLPAPAVAAPARMDPATWATILADSVAARQWLDSLRRVYPTDVPWAIDIARARIARASRARAAAERAAGTSAAAAINASTSDSLSTPPGTRAAPRDTVVRRDTAVRRDTNVARPDTVTTPVPVPPI
jgi:hypothetical protein